jgi:heat shock transcription factor 1
VKDDVSLKFSALKMRPVEDLGTNVPAFLAKLWKIVEDPETNDLICWSPVCDQKYYRRITLSLEPYIHKVSVFLDIF